MSFVRKAAIGVLCVALLALVVVPVQAQVIRTNAGFATTDFPGNDDGSTGPVALPFTANFFGTNYSQFFVNNNGNVTFDSPLGTYTPFSLLSTSHPMLAPFFGDVDTRAAGSETVHYGNDTVNGHAAFGVNWFGPAGNNGVGYFSEHLDKLNKFQLVVIDRSDVAPGDFDFEFNYGQIQWETGDASNGSGGLGGFSARAGWSDGVSNSQELPGSAVNGALIDGGPDALINSSNINTPGRWLFQVRNGSIGPSIPEPGSLAMFVGIGISGVGFLLRRRRAS